MQTEVFVLSDCGDWFFGTGCSRRSTEVFRYSVWLSIRDGSGGKNLTLAKYCGFCTPFDDCAALIKKNLSCLVVGEDVMKRAGYGDNLFKVQFRIDKV